MNARRILDQRQGPAVLGSALTRWAIEVFPGVESRADGSVAWITFWVDRQVADLRYPELIAQIQAAWPTGAVAPAAVVQWRVKGAPLADCAVLWGEVPTGDWITSENAVRLITRFHGVKHAGVFLDHAPLREWLTQHTRGLSVLNTFAYTGSLSIAAQYGSAAQISTVDLSASTIAWAKLNAGLASQSQVPEATPITQMEFWAADVLEWLPRTAKMIRSGKRRAFDVVILDPPSFSRSKNGVFSTDKDSERLHTMALEVLPATDGVLVSSVNSEFMTQEQFVKTVHSAARAAKRNVRLIQPLIAPQPFPAGQIKGGIFEIG